MCPYVPYIFLVSIFWFYTVLKLLLKTLLVFMHWLILAWCLSVGQGRHSSYLPVGTFKFNNSQTASSIFYFYFGAETRNIFFFHTNLKIILFQTYLKFSNEMWLKCILTQLNKSSTVCTIQNASILYTSVWMHYDSAD